MSKAIFVFRKLWPFEVDPQSTFLLCHCKPHFFFKIGNVVGLLFSISLQMACYTYISGHLKDDVLPSFTISNCQICQSVSILVMGSIPGEFLPAESLLNMWLSKLQNSSRITKKLELFSTKGVKIHNTASIWDLGSLTWIGENLSCVN